MGMDVGPSNGKKKKKGVGTPEMNVTPLVDVVLVLLIIFMVIMPMMNERFWIHVPPRPDENAEATPPDPDALQPLVVKVNERGVIEIAHVAYPDSDFPTRLRRMLVARHQAGDTDNKIYFDAANNVPFERAMAVMDLARGGGADNIAVMTREIH